MRELGDSFERIARILVRGKKSLYFVKFFKKLSAKMLLKKTLRIYSSPQKCSQMLWETNALRRCNDVKQYAELHFLKYCPEWIFKSSFSNPSVPNNCAQKNLIDLCKDKFIFSVISI